MASSESLSKQFKSRWNVSLVWRGMGNDAEEVEAASPLEAASEWGRRKGRGAPPRDIPIIDVNRDGSYYEVRGVMPPPGHEYWEYRSNADYDFADEDYDDPYEGEPEPHLVIERLMEEKKRQR